MGMPLLKEAYVVIQRGLGNIQRKISSRDFLLFERR